MSGVIVSHSHKFQDGRSIVDIKWSEEAGIGSTRKCLYRGDGAHFTIEDGDDEDRVISYRVNDIHLYCIFDGHDGSKASQFAAQQFPLELLLGQLEAPIDDEDVHIMIANAFRMVEEKFFENLEESASSAFFSRNGSANGSPDIKNEHYSGGTTAVMSVYCHGKLFFASCGDSVAVLCQLSPEGVLKIRPVSILHNIDSDDETLRLSMLGLDVEKLRKSQALKLTRCIGNYALKKYYQSFDILRNSITSPIICEPEIIGGIPVSQATPGFIYLMSSGLYKTWWECTGSENVEADIARVIATHLNSAQSLHDVAHAVLDEVCDRHAKAYAAGSSPHPYFRRDEMTLLIRNFGLNRKDVKAPPLTSVSDPGFVSYNGTLQSPRDFRHMNSDSFISTNDTADTDSFSVLSNTRSSDFDSQPEFVEPYVDFSEMDSLSDLEWSDGD